MATIVYPDGREQEVQPRNGSDFQLDELKAIVGQGAPVGQDYIEIVHMRDGRIMVINEEGKLLDLPRNDKATELAGLPTPQERKAATKAYRHKGFFIINTLGANEEDYIAGTVLVCLDGEVR